jgi:hypothetical protein
LIAGYGTGELVRFEWMQSRIPDTDYCRANIPAMTLCRVTRFDAYGLLCDAGLTKVAAAAGDFRAARARDRVRVPRAPELMIHPGGSACDRVFLAEVVVDVGDPGAVSRTLGVPSLAAFQSYATEDLAGPIVAAAVYSSSVSRRTPLLVSTIGIGRSTPGG